MRRATVSKEAIKFLGDRLDRSFDQRLITRTCRDVLKAVAFKTLPDGPCRCGNEALAKTKYARTSERTVRRCIDRGIELGLVRREPACRGLGCGKGRAHDTIYIVGFNDHDLTDIVSGSYQGLRDTAPDGPTGHALTTYRTFDRDQPDIKAAAYKEEPESNQKEKQSSPPTPSQNIGLSKDEERALKDANRAAIPSQQLRQLVHGARST